MNENQSKNAQAPIRDARTLGTPKMLILGLQHMFAMFGATVLVPILVQGYGLPLSIQSTLFFAGFGTLFFHVCTRMKVPAFLGSSFAFLGGFQAMAAMDSGIYAGMDPAVKLQYTCGGIVVAGLLYVVLAIIIKAVGVHKVMRFLPPVVTGPIIILIGLNLAPSAVSNASTCWWLALVAMAIIIVANIWGKGMIKIIPILLGVVGSYIVALVAGKVDFSSLAGTSIIGFQPFITNFSGSIAKFDVSAILVMAPIAIAAMMEQLYDRLLNDLRTGNTSSPVYRQHIGYLDKPYYNKHRRMPYPETEKDVIVADYISSMTDDYFVDLYSYLFPKSTLKLQYVGYFDGRNPS